MAYLDQDKIALSDDDMGQVIGGFSLDFLVAGSGGGMARTMEQTVIPGNGLTAATLQGGMKRCLRCGKPLAQCKCKTLGAQNANVVEL